MEIEHFGYKFNVDVAYDVSETCDECGGDIITLCEDGDGEYFVLSNLKCKRCNKHFENMPTCVNPHFSVIEVWDNHGNFVGQQRCLCEEAYKTLKEIISNYEADEYAGDY